MATTFSVAEITTNVQTLTASPAFSSSTRVTSAQVTYWFAQAVRAISALLRQRFPDDLDLVSIATLSVSALSDARALPTDTGEIQSVVWARAPYDYRPLRPAQQDDLTERTARDWTTCDPAYRVEDELLALYPAPTAATTLEVYYSTGIGYAGGSTQLLSRIDVDQWIALWIAAKVAMAKRQSPLPFDQARAMIENDLLSVERERDPNAVHTIRDVRGQAALQQYRRHWRSGG